MLTESLDRVAGVEHVVPVLDRLDTHRLVLGSVANSLRIADTTPGLAGVLDDLERELALVARGENHLSTRAHCRGGAS
jgi:hypothetical protein